MRLSNIISAVIIASAVGATAASSKSSSQSKKFNELRKNIKHVVYLMFENRSFDNIAGYWTYNKKINNLVGKKYCNDYSYYKYTVYNESMSICASPWAQEVPLYDPDHNFGGVMYQIYEKWNVTKDDEPTMGGFVQREAEQNDVSPNKAAFVMKGFREEETNVLETLAENFAFFDNYFSEHPGSTHPNREFATSGSSCGTVDNVASQPSGWNNNGTGFNCSVSVFEALSKKGISWKNYYEGYLMDAKTYQYVQDHDMDKIVHADQFYKDLEEGTLPTFSYINPECCNVDSMHPTSSLATGQQMLKHLYDSIRKSKYWDNVLLIINFDEHGGFADHVKTPRNIPAPEDGIIFNGTSDGHQLVYDFTQLGIRVPAMAISKWIKPNTLVHDDGTSYANNSEYTHTSFLHFLQELWELEGLNNRVQWAKTFEHIFQSTPQKNAIKEMPKPLWTGDDYNNEPAVLQLLNQDYPYYL
ncbi:phospholipase C [Dipodascopsis uninucleata]